MKHSATFFRYFLPFLIIYSVVCYVLEIEITHSNNSREGHPFWLWNERFVAFIFTLEYLYRLWKGKIKYAMSGMGFVDLVAIAPFWVGFFIPPEWLGLVRTLRTLRLLKLYRYSRSMRAFFNGLYKSKDRLLGIGIVVAVLVSFASVGMYELERHEQPEAFGSPLQSLWWCVVTFTTVGYGDAFPVTPLGRMFAMGMMLLGLGVMAAFIGIVGQTVIDELKRDEDEQKRDSDHGIKAEDVKAEFERILAKKQMLEYSKGMIDPTQNSNS